MADTQKHKNVRITTINYPDGVYQLIDKEGTVREYNTKVWDMQVIFTRKPEPVKPFPDGSLVLDTTDNSLFQKIGGRWHFIYLNQDDEEWTDFPTVTDRIIREGRVGKYKVLHEPESE